MPVSNEYYGNRAQQISHAPPPFEHEQQLEEERLRDDILRYLIKNSNGAFHSATGLRQITRDVVGIRVASREEFELAESSLLDLLYSDPQRRFSIVGEGDHILVKRAALDKDEISSLVEEWRCLIADFLLESKRNICLSDIGSSVPRPLRIPSSVKLIFIMKTDPLNRFILQGDGNSAKVKFNMHTDPDQESLWIAKWRDDIAILLNRSQWSGQSIGDKRILSSIGILEIEAHIDRPFFLHPDVHLVDVLSTDPFQRFVIIGSGINTHVTIRNFRGDEPEIMEFVEHWRVLIAEYLISKSAIEGIIGSHPLTGYGLSQVGAYVPRPFGVPASVKLVDVMRGDPINRFIMSGEGNALRATIVNSLNDGRRLEVNTHFQKMDLDQPEKIKASEQHNESYEFGRMSQKSVNSVSRHNQELTVAQKQLQILNAHSEWKARLGNPGVRNQQITSNQHISNQKQGSRNNSYNMTREYLTDMGRENLDHRRSTNDPNDMIGRAPFRDQYQSFQNRDDKSFYERQQFDRLSGNNDTNEDFSDDVPLDWNSLSQRDYNRDNKLDKRHSTTSQPLLDFHRDSEFNFGDADFSLRSNSHDERSVENSNDLRGLFVKSKDLGSPFSSSTCMTDSDRSLADYQPSITTDSGGMGLLFSSSIRGGSDSSSPQPLNNDIYVNHQNELNMYDSKEFPSNQHESIDQLLSTSVPLDKWMIKAWLPIAFDGFDNALISTFISKLRDDGGFVTLQDLLDAQSRGELTREALADIAGFKVGHCNRFEKALAAHKEVKSDL